MTSEDKSLIKPIAIYFAVLAVISSLLCLICYLAAKDSNKQIIDTNLIVNISCPYCNQQITLLPIVIKANKTESIEK